MSQISSSNPFSPEQSGYYSNLSPTLSPESAAPSWNSLDETQKLDETLKLMVKQGEKRIVTTVYSTANGKIRMYALSQLGHWLSVRRFASDPKEDWIHYIMKDAPIIIAWNLIWRENGSRDHVFLLVDSCYSLKYKLRWLKNPPQRIFLKRPPMRLSQGDIIALFQNKTTPRKEQAST